MIKIRTFAYYALPLFILGFFTYYLNSAHALKKPRNPSENVQLYIDRLGQDIHGGDWKEAAANYNRLKDAFEKVMPRIQVMVEVNDLTRFQETLARVNGVIKANDRASGMTQIESLRFYWRELGR